MVVGLGEWASRSVSAASERFHKDRQATLKIASERAAARLGEIGEVRTLGLEDLMGVQGPLGSFRVGAIPQPGVGPAADQGLGVPERRDPFDLLEVTMQGLIDQFRPSGPFDEAGISRQARADRERSIRRPDRGGLASIVEDVFRQVGRIRGGPASQEAFLPQNLGGLAPEIPAIIPEASERLGIRNRLLDEGLNIPQADYVIDQALKGEPVVEEMFELLGDRPGRLERVTGKALDTASALGGAAVDVARLGERIPTPFQPRGRQETDPSTGQLIEELDPVQTFYERYVNPTQANIAKLTAQAEGLPPPLGSPPVDIPSIGTEIDVTRPSPNIIRAARGDPEEIQKGQDILNDLGLARLPVELLFDPANLLPVIGFTKFPRFARELRAVSNLAGPARERALQALRESDLVQDLLRLTRSESGGPFRLQGGLPPRPQIDAELVSIQERLTALDTEIVAKTGKKGVKTLREERVTVSAELARVEAQVAVDDILRRDIDPSDQLSQVSGLHADAKDDLDRLFALNAEAEGLTEVARGGKQPFAPFGEKPVAGTKFTEERVQVPGTISQQAKEFAAAKASDRTFLRASEAAITAREKVYADFLSEAQYVPVEPAQVAAGRMDLTEFIDEAGKPSVRLKSGEVVEAPTFRGEGARVETQEGLGLTIPETVPEGQAALPTGGSLDDARRAWWNNLSTAERKAAVERTGAGEGRLIPKQHDKSYKALLKSGRVQVADDAFETAGRPGFERPDAAPSSEFTVGQRVNTPDGPGTIVQEGAQQPGAPGVFDGVSRVELDSGGTKLFRAPNLSAREVGRDVKPLTVNPPPPSAVDEATADIADVAHADARPTRIMNLDVKIEKSQRAGGVDYELYRATGRGQDGAVIRVVDDSGNVVSTGRYPTFAAADAEYVKATDAARLADSPKARAATAPTGGAFTRGNRVETPRGPGTVRGSGVFDGVREHFVQLDTVPEGFTGGTPRFKPEELTPIGEAPTPTAPVQGIPEATKPLPLIPPRGPAAEKFRNRWKKAKTDATKKKIEDEWIQAHGLEKVPIGSGYGRTTAGEIVAAPRQQVNETLARLRGETPPSPTGAVAPERRAGTFAPAELVEPEVPTAPARAPEVPAAAERPHPPPPGTEAGTFPTTAAPSRALPEPTGQGQIAAPPATRALVATPDQAVDDVLTRALADVKPVTVDDLDAFLREPKPGQILPDGTIAGAAPGELRPKGPMLSPTQRRQVMDAVPPGGGEGPPTGVTASGEILPEPGPGRLMPPLPSLEELLTDPFFERNTARWVSEHASQVPGVRQGIIAMNPSGVERYGDLGKLQAAYNRLLESANATDQFGMAAIRRLKDPFPVNAEGDVVARGLSAGPDAPGMAWDDVMERLPRYEGVTDDMVKYRDTVGQVLDEAIAEFELWGGDLNKIGFVEGERWIPRQVLGKNGIEKTQSMLKKGVGAKQGFEKSRMHEYAAQTLAAGNDLNTDKLAVIETTLSAIRRATIDLQFEALVKPRGRLPSQLIPKELKEDVVEALKGVRRARRAVDDERARLRITPRTKTAKPARGVQRAVVEAAKDRLANARAVWNQARSTRTRAIKGLSFAQEGWKFGRDEPLIAITRTPPGKLPGLQGRLFPTDDIKFLTQVMEDRTPEWLNKFNQVGGLARVAMTAFDPGFWFIQGLGPLGKDLANLARGRPTLIWARAVKRSMQALGDPAVHADYIARQFAENPEMMERFAKYYRGLQWSEYVESARSGGLLYKAGGPVRSVTQRAQIFFDSWMDVAAIEGWKAGEKYTLLDPTKLEQLGGHLRNLTGNLSTAGLGVSRSQRAIEAGFIRFAPRYTRAAFALVFDAMQGGLRGSEARAALGGMGVLGAASYYAVATALGQDPEFRPWKGGAFLSVKVGEGDEANYIGIGGVYRSLLRFGGDIARSIEENGPDDFVKISDDNPIVRYLRSGAAPLTGTAWDIYDGENFIGEPLRIDDPETFFRRVGSRFLPFWLQGALEANGGVKERLTVATAEFFGGRAFPASIFGRRDDSIANWATTNGETDADGNPITRYSGTSGGPGVANRAQRKAYNATQEGESLSDELKERNLEREDVTTKTLNAIDDLRARVVIDPSTAATFGLTTTQEQDNKALARNEIDGAQWRDRFSDRMTALRDIRATTEDETLREILGLDFDIEEPPPGSVDALINAYFDVVPVDFADDTGVIDWDAYFTKKDTAFKTAIRRGGDLVKEYLRPFEDDPVIREFRQAQGLRNQLESVPKYQGLSAPQGEIIDEFLDQAGDLVDIWFRESRITYPLIRAIKAQADFNGQKSGGVHESGWEWENIKGWAILLRPGSRTRNFYSDPARDSFIQDNAEPLLTFFPELSQQLSRPQISGLSDRQFETALTQR